MEVHKEPVSLIGYHGDTRKEKANVIVRRVHVGPDAKDLGFVKKPGGTYAAIVSEFDSGKHDASWFNGLKRAYTERVTLKTAAKSGFRFLGKKVINGKAQLQFMDPRA